MIKLNKTYLSIDSGEERVIIHRDMIAHCLRWSHVVKRLYEKQSYQTAHILDVGCGKEIPLLKLLYVNKMSPFSYTGVDAGNLELPDFIDKMRAKFIIQLFPHTDFVFSRSVFQLQNARWTHITCFEVLEHMPKDHGLKLLDAFKESMNPQTTLFLSTPCYNGSMANNHIYEWEYGELRVELERRFKLVGHWGTFASIRDYESGLSPALTVVFDQLRDYYDTNYLATIFAPLFPAQSRNVLWEVKLG